MSAQTSTDVAYVNHQDLRTLVEVGSSTYNFLAEIQPIVRGAVERCPEDPFGPSGITDPERQEIAIRLTVLIYECVRAGITDIPEAMSRIDFLNIVGDGIAH